MAYFLFRSSNTTTPFAIINQETIDTTSSSLSLVGKRRVDYGQSQQQNQLWLLENFAAASQPANAITGQLWYDTAVSYLKVYNGTSFVRVANSVVSNTAPPSASAGQFWFNNTTQQLNVFNGSVWVIVGPQDDAVVFSIVFGS
jgi:hypothetical protein